MIAGQLEIQIFANLAKLSADMNSSKGMVSGAMQDISRAVDQAKGVLASLGLTATVGGLALLVKGGIDAADSLNDLSKSTGLAVEKLAGLRFAAKQSGGDLDGIAASVNKLSVNIGKNAEKFTALGITAKDPLEAMKQFADVFAAIKDPQLRAALGAEALGKSWESAAPLLAEGGKKIGEMVEQGEKAAAMTKELAEQADAFNDKLVVLGGNGGTLNQMLAQMLPLLNRVLDDFISLRGEGGSLGETLGSALAEVLRVIVVLGGNVGFVLRGIGTELGGLAAQAAAVAVGDFARAAEIGRMMTADAEEARKKFDAWEQSILAVGAASKGAATSMKSLTEEELEAARIAEAAKKAAEAKAKAFLAGQEARKKKSDWRFEAAKAELAAEEMFARDYAEAWKWADHYRNEEVKAAAAEREAIAKAEQDGQEMFAKDYVEAWKYANEFVIGEERKRIEEARNYWGGFLDGIEGAFRQGWMAFGDGAKSAAKVAQDALKRTLYDWLWQAMAKPIVLNIIASGANSMGLSGLGSLATSAAAGGPNILGSIGSLVSSFAGPELLGSAGAAAGSGFLGSMGSMLSAAGPYVAAIVAAYALYKAFADKGENWKGKLGFGANANAYTTTGPFGVQGFEYLAGDDTTNRAIQSFMGSTIGIDRQLAGRMTPAQIASITGRLGGAYTTRADGQPAEFAFGKDDTTAAAQLTKEYLQRKYSIVFEQIDAEFAEFIRTFGGTSEELLAAIGEFAGILDALDATGIKGLNLETLKAFKREGESLGEAFARVSKMWNEYQNLFLTDAEKLALVQDQVAGVFEGLGIAVPASMEEFKALVNSLDLSTEAGRAAFQALMAVAPAFATVANAAKSLLATFDQIVGSMRPGYSKGVLEQSLEAEVKKFMGGASWTSGMDWRYVSSQLRNITREDFQNYSTAQQQIITTILSIMSQLDGLGDAAGDAGRTITGLGGTAATAINAMADAKDNLWAYLRGLYTNSSLSPLDPMQQLGVAKSDFLDLLGLAQGGDVGAANGLQGAIERALGIARTVYGSAPGYRDFFDWITTAAGEFSRPGQSQDLQAGIYAEARTGNEIMREVRQILLDIRDKGTADGEQVAGAVQNAALATERR